MTSHAENALIGLSAGLMIGYIRHDDLLMLHSGAVALAASFIGYLCKQKVNEMESGAAIWSLAMVCGGYYGVSWLLLKVFT